LAVPSDGLLIDCPFESTVSARKTTQCQKKENDRMATATATASPKGALLGEIYRHRKQTGKPMSAEAYTLLMQPSAELQEVLDYWDGKKRLSDLGEAARAMHDEWLHHSKQGAG
jgi:hypothetical protein